MTDGWTVRTSKIAMMASSVLRRRFWPLRSTDRDPQSRIDVRQLAGMTEDNARRAVAMFTREDIKSAWADDPYNRNYFLNLWECEKGQVVLESYPWNVSLPVADLCNARCTFCNSWLRGKSFLTVESLGMYAEVLPYARLIGIQGHGEPLANPEIDRVLRGIAALIDKRAQGYIITNGVFLEKHLPLLLASRITVFNVSLNATTEQTHDVVMGLGRHKLKSILQIIHKIVQIRDTKRPELQVTISMVLTSDNIHEAADFVRLGNELNVNRIYLRTLMAAPAAIPGLNYHLLPPILNSEFENYAAQARLAIEISKVAVESQPETWITDTLSLESRRRVTVSPPAIIHRNDAMGNRSIRSHYKEMRTKETEKGTLGERFEDVFDLRENPYKRETPFSCRFVYHNLITTHLDFRINPCCYMSTVPGHRALILGSEHSFMTYWNSEALVNLRRRLRTGPLFQACTKCPMQG